jgi:hypothetical protein
MILLNLLLLFNMYLFYNVEVTIGKIIMTSINAVEIRSSWKTLTDTADITIPRNFKYKDQRIDQMIKRLDPVTIKLGYNGQLFTEFTGYVREVEPNVPLKIYCEDEMLKLKGAPITKTWSTVTLKNLVKEIAPGYEYEVSDISLGKLSVTNASAAHILESLKDYGVFCYFRGIRNGKPVLHAGFPYDFKYNTVVYDFQKNVKSNSLKFKLKGDYKVQVKAIANLNNGKKTVVFFPQLTTDEKRNAEQRTLNFGQLSDNETERESLLKKYAEAEMKKFSVEGYRGDITGFCIPFTQHGDKVVIRDTRYPERESSNIIDGVNIRWQVGQHFERINEIGPRV